MSHLKSYKVLKVCNIAGQFYNVGEKVRLNPLHRKVADAVDSGKLEIIDFKRKGRVKPDEIIHKEATNSGEDK